MKNSEIPPIKPIMDSSKKSPVKLIFTGILVLAIVLGAVIAYKNKEGLLNRYYLLTKSPREYYIHIEKYGLYRLLPSFQGESGSTASEAAYHISSKMTFNHKPLNSVMHSAFGTDLSELEQALGIPVDSINLEMELASGNNAMRKAFSLGLNNAPLLTLEVLQDVMNHRLFMRIPELNTAYLSQAADETMADSKPYQNQLDHLNSDTLKRLASRYTDLIFNSLAEVSLSRNVPLSLDALSVKCNLLTVTLTREEAYQLALTLLETAERDEDILLLLPLAGLTKDQYTQAIENSKEALQTQREQDRDTSSLQMQIYVDKQGHIVGRKISSSDHSSLSYSFLSGKDYREYDAQITDTDGSQLLHVTGKYRSFQAAKSGDMVLHMRIPYPESFSTDNLLSRDLLSQLTSPSSFKNMKINISYEDVRREHTENRAILFGTFTLSSPELKGLQIISEYGGEGTNQLNTTTLLLGATDLLTLSSSCTPLGHTAISLPEDTDNQFRFNQMDEYLSSINWNEYYSSVSNALGTDQVHLAGLLRFLLQIID